MAFFVALTSSLVLYVYRFAAFGVNLSLFRLVFIAWSVKLAIDLVRGRRRIEAVHWPFLAVAAGVAAICVIDFSGLSAFPALRRDLANHLVNVAFAGLIVMYVDTAAKVTALLRAFVYSSILTTAITIYSGIVGSIPFEGAIRSAGSEQGRALAYLNDDTVFARSTSSFFDPNFYGIYSMLVITAVVYLWLFSERSRALALLFVVNLVCLTLTLSRTAVIGVLVVFGLTFLLSPPSRRFAVAAAIATVVLLYSSTTFQSYAAYERMVASASEAWESVKGWWPDVPQDTAQPSPATGVRSAGPARGSADPTGLSQQIGAEIRQRVSTGKSLDARVEYINRGLSVFAASPLFGQGSAALTSAENPWSSAHVTYLTLLARYGVAGALVYAAFLVLPLLRVWRRGTPAAARLLVTLSILPLMVVYLSYDVFLFFEIQYVFFGLAFAVALQQPWAAESSSRPGRTA
jgi:O-Antigen ligase